MSKSNTLPADPPCTLAEGRFVRLMRRRSWEWAERTNTSAAVVIAAITTERQLVLIEQYRVPLDCNVIELPAGLVGDLDHARHETLEEAAHRELIEETGYAADHFEYLFDGPSSPGLTNEMYTMLLARDVHQVGPGGGDSSEDIQVHLVPLDEVDAWLKAKSREGMMVSPKVYSALYFAR